MTITRPRFPVVLLICSAVLAAVGLAAIARGDDLASGQYAQRQFVWLTLSLPAAVAVQCVPYRRFQYVSGWLFLACLALLVAVYFMPPVNGSRRWIPLGPAKFQPSEPAKLAYVCALAAYLRHRDAYRRLVGLLVPFALTLIPIGLILKEPDLGTALLFIPVLFAMLFAAGARIGHLLFVMACGLLCVPWLWHAMSAEQRSRVTAVLVQRDGGPVPRDGGYHLYQSKRVLLSGGWFGSAFSDAGIARDEYHLPAARTDFVFCLVGERFGIAGCLVVLACCAGITAEGLRIAATCRDPFGRLVCVGITTLFASQAAINMSMTVGLMPITGMTLPLVSYGGSSVLFSVVGLSGLLNVARYGSDAVAPEPFRFARSDSETRRSLVAASRSA